MLKQLASCLVFFILLNASAQSVTRIEGFAQGTTYHISYVDTQNRNFQTEIDSILNAFDLSVSTYKPNSIISRINANEKNVKVDPWFTICFKTAKAVFNNTNGAFDPTVFPLTRLWGFGPEKRQKADSKTIDSMLQFVNFDLIRLKGKRIVKKDARVQLDFNAFAQGYSVDVISDFLRAQGIQAFLVEIGGEVYAEGQKPDGNFWTVGVEQPIDNKETENPLQAVAQLNGLAVATSGDYRRFFIEDGVKYAHHLDPKTGYPVKTKLLSVSVFSKKCIQSDAYATGILVMGLEKAKLFLVQHPELQAYLIYSDESGNYLTYQTPGLSSIISKI